MKTFKFTLLVLLTGMLMSCSNKQQSNNAIPSTSVKDTVSTNTLIVDVRTPEEWEQDGHAGCSVNIPLDELSAHIDSLRKYDKLVVVCRSGNRANSAKEMLQEKGFKNVENLGPWQNIQCK